MTIRSKRNQPVVTQPKGGWDSLNTNPALNALLDGIRDPVIYFDRWGNAQHANQSAVNWLGGVAFQGKSFVELASDWDDPAERQREIMQVGRSGIAIADSRERCFAPSGDFWYSVDKIPLNINSDLRGVMLVVRDITKSVLRELSVRDSEARYRAYIANSMDAIWRYDVCPPVDITLPGSTQVDLIIQRSVLSECNQKLADLYGAPSTTVLLGMPLNHNGSPTMRDDVVEFVRNGYRLQDREYERQNSLGQTISLQCNSIGIVEHGYLTRVWGTTRDITDKCRYLARLEYLANYDVLTALPNRSVLYRTISKSLSQADDKQNMALLLIDLDRFKEINDTLGHLAGDKVLKQLGPRLQSALEHIPSLVARLGGDEFAVFLPRLRNTQQAVILAHRLIDSVALTFEVEGLRTEISASIGVALCPQQARDVSTLMRFADVAMYRAKRSLQSVAIYDPVYDPHSPKRLELMGALGRAIRENELTLYLQPKIHIQSNKVYGFEGLLRWNHPELGIIPPGDFIPIAEHSNLIHPLTMWVFETGIRYCRYWLDRGHNISVALNLSARNLLDDRIVTDLSRLLKKYDVPPACCELEITESAIMSDPARAEAALHRIHALGVNLSVDDFGTGYSSLSYLKRLPVKTLKIDRSFVGTMLMDDQDDIIVKSIVQLAHNLGLQVVAEGVESEEVYQRLGEIGCDYAQGFYMGKPVSLEEAEQWLLTSAWGTQEAV